jgi:hypothetical protein
MQVTEKQKKYIWIVVAVLVLIHFAPRILVAVKRTFSSPPPAVVQKFGPVQPAPPPAPSPAPPAVPAVDKQLMDYYSGVWTGHMLMPKGDTCDLRLELRVKPDEPAKLVGYETKTCVPFMMIQHRNAAGLARDISPVSAVMIGTLDHDYIHFTIDQTMGTHLGDCPLSVFTTRVFGLGGLNAEWKEGTCNSGSLLLMKKG